MVGFIASPSDHVAPAVDPGTDAPTRKALAATLRRHRHGCAKTLLRSMAESKKFSADIAARGDDLDDMIRRELYAFVDYLALFLETGDESYVHLYVGEKLKQLYVPDDSPEDRMAWSKTALATDKAALTEHVRSVGSAAQAAALENILDRVAAVITAKPDTTVDILLVGDCVYLDILAFAAAPLRRDGIAVNPTFITSKNPAEQRAQIRRLADRRFSAVFYSPLTYEFSIDFAELLSPRNAAAGANRIKTLADRAWTDIEKQMDLLAGLFECNMFVHNTAGLRRMDGSAKESIKNLLTARTRRRAAAIMNARVAEHLAKINAATFPHLFPIDEGALAASRGRRELSRLMYASELQHPAAFGRFMAPLYCDIIAVQAQLLSKKVVVCDLDNTLWDGLIGEGAVRHHADRQRSLLELKRKGVVLAVNSKNDPAKVHWRDCALSEKDFVCLRINWNNKVNNLREIQADLNLKLKDFVFIDDRPDEREMVSSAFPEMKVLDATDPRAWDMLDLWGRLSAASDGGDRTLFYQQREQRAGFLESQATKDDPATLFQRLELSVTLRQARNADLKRAAELINRTNQFNTGGSRTSVRELGEFATSGGFILLADCADKFGSMGTVSVLTARMDADRVTIPMFVLSCRVFGYGIETTLINRVKRLAMENPLAGTAGRPVEGLYRQTPHNDPCKDVYPNNGFAWSNDRWVWQPSAIPADPSWLTMRNA